MTGRARSSAATETVGRSLLVGHRGELAQDALVIALSEWRRTSVPANPGAWLMKADKRRAIDAIRRDKMCERKHEEIRHRPDGSLTTEVRLPSARQV